MFKIVAVRVINKYMPFVGAIVIYLLRNKTTMKMIMLVSEKQINKADQGGSLWVWSLLILAMVLIEVENSGGGYDFDRRSCVEPNFLK